MRRTEYPAAIRDLIAQLRQMPGVGPRSAERIALWIVQARGPQPQEIARAITETRATVRPCQRCGFFTTDDICEICGDPARSADLPIPPMPNTLTTRQRSSMSHRMSDFISSSRP